MGDFLGIDISSLDIRAAYAPEPDPFDFAVMVADAIRRGNTTNILLPTAITLKTAMPGMVDLESSVRQPVTVVKDITLAPNKAKAVAAIIEKAVSPDIPGELGLRENEQTPLLLSDNMSLYRSDFQDNGNHHVAIHTRIKDRVGDGTIGKIRGFQRKVEALQSEPDAVYTMHYPHVRSALYFKTEREASEIQEVLGRVADFYGVKLRVDQLTPQGGAFDHYATALGVDDRDLEKLREAMGRAPLGMSFPSRIFLRDAKALAETLKEKGTIPYTIINDYSEFTYGEIPVEVIPYPTAFPKIKGLEVMFDALSKRQILSDHSLEVTDQLVGIKNFGAIRDVFRPNPYGLYFTKRARARVDFDTFISDLDKGQALVQSLTRGHKGNLLSPPIATSPPLTKEDGALLTTVIKATGEYFGVPVFPKHSEDKQDDSKVCVKISEAELERLERSTPRGSVFKGK